MTRYNLFYCLLNKKAYQRGRQSHCMSVAVLLMLVVMSGCTSAAPAETPPVVEVNETPTTMVSTPASATEIVTSFDPNNLQPANVSTIPVALSIPAIELNANITEMGWIVTEVDGERTSRWAIPYSDAGWHVNSAGAGTDGNVVISGHQVVGEAVFAPLALGEVQVGQEIQLTDIRGEVFAYEVVEITEPIPLAGATDEEQALAASYIAPSPNPKLTLMTGWPDFATTHHLFIVADFAGEAE